MAGGPSVWLANKILNKTLKGVDWTPPTTFYAAIFTDADETDLRANAIASASEVPNANSYARVAVLASDIASASAGSTSISVTVPFPTATGYWGIVTYGALMSVATWGTGDIYYFGPLTTPKEVQVGDIFRIPLSTFVIAL